VLNEKFPIGLPLLISYGAALRSVGCCGAVVDLLPLLLEFSQATHLKLVCQALQGSNREIKGFLLQWECWNWAGLDGSSVAGCRCVNFGHFCGFGTGMAVRINRSTEFSLGLLLFLVQVIESNVLRTFLLLGLLWLGWN